MCCLFAPESSSHVLLFWNDSSSRKFHQDLSLRQARRFIKEPGHADTYVGLKGANGGSCVCLFFHTFCWKCVGNCCDRSLLGGGFEYVLFLPPTWEDDPIWLIFFKWVETTNQFRCFSDNDLVMRNFTWMQGQVGEPIGSHHTIPQPNSRDLSSSHLVVFSKGNLQQIALLWVWGNHKSSFLEGWISLVLEETRELTSTNLPTIWLAWVLFLGAPAKSRKNGVQKNVPNQLVGVCWGKWLATSSTGPTPVPCRIFFLQLRWGELYSTSQSWFGLLQRAPRMFLVKSTRWSGCFGARNLVT